MSGLHNSSRNGSASNLPDDSGRSSATSFSAQSGAPPPVYHHIGSTQGLHNIHGNFNVANRPITFGTVNVADIPASGVQQPSGNLSSAVAGAGLPIRGLDSRLNLTNNSGPGNLNVKGLNRLMGGVHQQASPAVSSMLGDSYHGAGPHSQNISSMGLSNDVSANDGASFKINDFSQLNNRPSSGGGHQGQGSVTKKAPCVSPTVQQQIQEFSFKTEEFPAFPGFKAASPTNQTNRMPIRLPFTSVLTASPAVSSMLGDSYHGAGPHSQNISSMGLSNDVNANDGASFKINDFSQLNNRPSSGGGHQGEGSVTKKAPSGSPTVQQQIQEFSFKTGEFPAFPGFKAASPTNQTNRMPIRPPLTSVLTASPAVSSMLGDSYHGAGPHSQNISSMGLSNDVNANDGASFKINDFSQLNNRPSSGGGHQGQGSVTKKAPSVSPTVQQQIQEFSFKTGEFPAFPGFKASSPTNQTNRMPVRPPLYFRPHGLCVGVHDNAASTMQPQQFPVGRSAGLNNFGGSSSSHHPQQQQQQFVPPEGSSSFPISSGNNQDMCGSDFFPSSHASYHPQVGRSARFYLGESSSSHRPHQQQQFVPPVSSSGFPFSSGNNQDMCGSDFFPSSHASYHPQVGRSAGFYLGESSSSHRPHQQQQLVPPVSSSGFPSSSGNYQDMRGSDFFPSSYPSYHPQMSGAPVNIGSYDHLFQLHQQLQDPSIMFRLQQISGAGLSMPCHDSRLNLTNNSGSNRLMGPTQSYGAPPQSAAGSYGMLGLLDMLQKKDPNRPHLAFGIDLQALGLDMKSTDKLHKIFSSPWSNFTVPECYNAANAPELSQQNFSRLRLMTLFYIFNCMPRNTAQLYAANELHNRGWLYHRVHRFWFKPVPNMKPLAKTNTHERGSYIIFVPETWELFQKDNFVVYYELLEPRPALPRPPQQ